MTGLFIGCGMCCDGTMYRSVEAGEVSHDDAVGLIAKTTALGQRVRSSLAAYVDTPKRLSFDAMPDPAAGRRDHAELLLDIVALRVVLTREFEPRDSKSHLSDEAPAATPSLVTGVERDNP